MDHQASSSSSSSDSDDDYVFVRRRKVYRERVNNLEKFDDLDFFDRFRITKPTFHLLLETIEHLIETPTNRGGSIKPINQVLLTLRFYALGCMQKAVADFTGVSTPSACRIISKVSNAIASLHRQHIKMYETYEEMESSAAKFYQVARFLV
ncbi:hypothetical protein JTB14_008017 [Gonioctena quinquepunctata]|nr:hypothetical protein JTB14_008017 [Gonioctena quinquepunctata]